MVSRVPQDIGDYPFDLIVVGAGINGAGIARDAAMRGLKVLLLDKGDIASGTTQWATRLIHGGLRYLEYYEVSLVRESSSSLWASSSRSTSAPSTVRSWSGSACSATIPSPWTRVCPTTTC
jgi:glycine/D-amino acid oxidase-like deaminating enzyme